MQVLGVVPLFEKPPLCKGRCRFSGGGVVKNNPSVDYVDSSLYTRDPFV